MFDIIGYRENWCHSMLNRCKFFTISLVLLFFYQVVYGQDNKEQAKQLVEIADEIYKANLGLDQAREQYEQAAILDPENLHANYMTGELYILRGPYKERSTEFLLKVYKQDPQYRFDILYKIAQGYQYGLSFDKAIEFYTLYQDKLIASPNYRGEDKVPSAEVDRRIQECNNGKLYVANPEEFSIVNIGEMINSPAYDFAPVINEDETMLIFTSRRQDGNTNENVDNDNFYFEDIYISRKNGDTWGQAENIGPIINSANHDSNLAISADGKTLYIYRDENGGDIFFSDLNKDGTWSDPLPMGGNINSSYFENAVTISPNRNILFFSSDRPSGLGGLDIYMVVKDSRGQWGKVTNLGPEINTIYDEDGPFINYDGKTLYFSSRGHEGMGGFDIYKSEYDSSSQKWTPPVNLGYPINTPDDDVYFVPTKDGQRGYYSSVKDDGMGYTDIYMIKLPDLSNRTSDKIKAQLNKMEETKRPPEREVNKVEEPVNKEIKKELMPVTLLVRVEESGSQNPLDVKFSMRTIKDNVLVPFEQVEAGTYRLRFLLPTGVEHMLTLEKEGYLFKNFKINIPAAGSEPQEIRRRFEMQPFALGAHDVLRNIYFDFGRASFKKESYFELNKLEKMLFENPNYKIEISGHTDNIGRKNFNKWLSRERAAAVVSYLVGKGIDQRRLVGRGYGDSKPIASNDDEKDGRSLNRRVEFLVVEEKF
jgi:outer membrane protein OmpA-like peptidoglycan-associated protein/tetratricopeptide (TPR) repeat protein